MASSKGSAVGNYGDYFQHIVGVRMRIAGAGNLQMKFFSLDDVRVYDIGNLSMSLFPGRLVDRICNVPYEQRSYFEIKTTEIDETFRLDKLIFFTKPIATQIPG